MILIGPISACFCPIFPPRRLIVAGNSQRLYAITILVPAIIIMNTAEEVTRLLTAPRHLNTEGTVQPVGASQRGDQR
jgi:hypothetical protein